MAIAGVESCLFKTKCNYFLRFWTSGYMRDFSIDNIYLLSEIIGNYLHFNYLSVYI